MWSKTARLAVFITVALLLCGQGALAIAGEELVWSGERRVQGRFVVPAGQVLLILPGSRISFAPGERGEKGELLIQGTLLAQGRPDALITFAAAETGQNWQGIRLATDKEQAPSRLEWASIRGALAGLTGRSGQALVSDVEFTENEVGIDIRGEVTGIAYHCRLHGNQLGVRVMAKSSWQISSSEISDNRSGGVLCQGSSPRIQGCQLRNNPDYGIACWQGASPELLENSISGSLIGISVDRGSSPLIKQNRITDNQTGIKLTRLAFPEITGNLINRNQVGLLCDLGGYPWLQGNSLAENQERAIVLGEFQSVVGARLGPQPDFQPPGATPRQQVPATLFPEDGIIDARQNWWGEGALQEMTTAKDVNLSFVDDGYDRPQVHYQEQIYPRDRLAVLPGLTAPPVDLGPQPHPLTGLSGHLLLAGQPLVNARIHLYPQSAECGSGPGAVFSAPTGPGGEFLIRLRPGIYQLLVEQNSPPLPGSGRCWRPATAEVEVGTGIMTELEIRLPQP